MTKIGRSTLSSLKCPEEVGLKRGLPPGTRVEGAEFWERYDQDTLIYDCFFRPEISSIIMYLPKLYDFEPMMKTLRFLVDGMPVPTPRLRRFERFEQMSFKFEGEANHLRILGEGWTTELPIQKASIDKFRGKNVLYTMLKNEELTWVRDWTSFHQREHGADAVLIANNGSTTYSSDALRETVLSVDGIKCVEIIDVPLPYGPVSGISRSLGRTMFLQTSMLNLVRDRFLSKARAVLNGDIDELVVSHNGQSIFDATVAGWGYITIPGEWRYAASSDSGVLHKDHWLIDEDGPKCHPKYCIVPDSLLGKMCWSVHSLESVNRRFFSGKSRFHLLHCRNISTSWNWTKPRALEIKNSQREDRELRLFLSQKFT